jgi:hypothetical protein
VNNITPLLTERRQSQRARLTLAIHRECKRERKKLFSQLSQIDFGLVMDTELPYIGYTRYYLQKEKNRYVCSGAQLIRDMHRAYAACDINSACNLANARDVLNLSNCGWTWMLRDFEIALVEFFLLLASYTPNCLSNHAAMSLKQLQRIEDLAIGQVCAVFLHHKSGIGKN